MNVLLFTELAEFETSPVCSVDTIYLQALFRITNRNKVLLTKKEIS
jgi:hypothetical protein